MHVARCGQLQCYGHCHSGILFFIVRKHYRRFRNVFFELPEVRESLVDKTGHGMGAQVNGILLVLSQ